MERTVERCITVEEWTKKIGSIIPEDAMELVPAERTFGTDEAQSPSLPR